MIGIHAMVGTTIRNRAVMANALCAVAEEEMHAGRIPETRETLGAIRMLLADISILMSGDTSYLPYGVLREMAELLAGLDERVRTVEHAIGPQTIH
jgi:hypothetical protein